MPKIKWIGLIKEEKMKDYQVGELSKNAKKMNMPTTSKEMMIKALPFIIPAFLILFLSVYFKSGEIFFATIIYNNRSFVGIFSTNNTRIITRYCLS